MPGVVYFEPPRVRQKEPTILGVPLKMVEATVNRVCRNGGPPIEIMEFDEHWKPDHPRVALIRTKTAGDKVLKTQDGTGQEGMLNEGLAQRVFREVGLNSVKIGVDGLRSRD